MRDILDKLNSIPSPVWVEKYLFPSILIISIITFVVLTLYASFQIPINPNYTKATRAAYVLTSFAFLIGFIVAYVLAKNRWIILLITIAIELFISGMFFELVSIIDKAY